jgi:hypothetical protein
MSSGSCDSRTDSTVGLQPERRQIRPIDERLRPTLFAIERVLQWVRPRGVDSRVLVTTASTASSVIERAAPGRGSSCSPSSRFAMNRDLHLPTLPR